MSRHLPKVDRKPCPNIVALGGPLTSCIPLSRISIEETPSSYKLTKFFLCLLTCSSLEAKKKKFRTAIFAFGDYNFRYLGKMFLAQAMSKHQLHASNCSEHNMLFCYML